jgi:hypothetical protein
MRYCLLDSRSVTQAVRPGVLRACVALSLLAPLSAADAQAQSIPQSIPQSASSSCSISAGNRVLRSGVGATLGAWIGFVAAKIKLSDWNDASRGAAANRTRNKATVVGAVIGLALANIPFGSHSCGGAEAPSPVSPPVPAARRPITADEIAHSGVSTNVYDLVYSLRRNWLNVRGIETLSEAPRTVEAGGAEVTIPGEPQLVIYLDNTRLGTLSQLRQLPVAGVVGVRYFDGPQATYKWGMGHSHGAIVVVTLPELMEP